MSFNLFEVFVISNAVSKLWIDRSILCIHYTLHVSNTKKKNKINKMKLYFIYIFILAKTLHRLRFTYFMYPFV